MTTGMRWRALEWPSWARWATTGAFFVAVNWLLLAPARTFREVHLFLAQQDKIAHAAIFLVLVLLVRWSLSASVEGAGGRLQFAALTALVLYAGAIELLQPLLAQAGRRFEWLDLASNYTGVAAGWWLFGVARVTKTRGPVVTNPLDPPLPKGE